MADGLSRDRLILGLVLGRRLARAGKREKPQAGSDPKIRPVADRIIGKPGLGSESRFEARALASPRQLWLWVVYSKTSIRLARAATRLSCLIAVEQRPHRFDM